MQQRGRQRGAFAAVGHRHVLGPHADLHRAAGRHRARIHRGGQHLAGHFHTRMAGFCRHQGAGQQVHLRAADEFGHEGAGRAVVQRHRAAHLGHAAALFDQRAGVQQHDLVGQRHGLDLVVRHVDHAGRTQVVVQLGDLQPGLHPQRGVQVRQRLVEQEHLGLLDDGAADGHPLALAARQHLGQAIHQRAELQDVGRGLHLGGDGGLVSTHHLQAEGHVLGHRHVRVQRIALEHHGHAALGRWQIIHPHAADAEVTGGDVFQPRHAAQQRALAAARRADEDAELAVVDGERGVADGQRQVGAVALVDLVEIDA